MSAPDDLPSSLLEKHPELPAIHAALAEHHAGSPITAACPTCAAILVVTEVRELGVMVVICPAGHVNYRQKTAPR